MILENVGGTCMINGEESLNPWWLNITVYLVHAVERQYYEVFMLIPSNV
jgi:hypothetical protein